MQEDRRRRIRTRSPSELSGTLETAQDLLATAQARERAISSRLLRVGTAGSEPDPAGVRDLTTELSDAHRDIVLLQARIVRVEREIAEAREAERTAARRDA